MSAVRATEFSTTYSVPVLNSSSGNETTTDYDIMSMHTAHVHDTSTLTTSNFLLTALCIYMYNMYM